MKSEKYLNRIFKPMSPIQNKVKAYDRDMVNKVIKIAEQEAEERMRAKAIKAYCQSCHGTAVGECLIGTKNCGALRDFIQNLNRG
jgi:hypothetical protein